MRGSNRKEGYLITSFALPVSQVTLVRQSLRDCKARLHARQEGLLSQEARLHGRQEGKPSETASPGEIPTTVPAGAKDAMISENKFIVAGSQSKIN
jgi:hypothetical protein